MSRVTLREFHGHRPWWRLAAEGAAAILLACLVAMVVLGWIGSDGAGL